MTFEERINAIEYAKDSIMELLEAFAQLDLHEKDTVNYHCGHGLDDGDFMTLERTLDKAHDTLEDMRVIYELMAENGIELIKKEEVL